MELPPCKRYITTVLPDGKSVHRPFSPLIHNELPGTGSMARAYSIKSIPAQLQGEEDIKAYESDQGVASHKSVDIVGPGANLSVVNLAPGAESPMHKTPSLDFSVCVAGVVDHILDSGESIRLYPGDHVVQRETNHKWVNASSSEAARLIAVILQVRPSQSTDRNLYDYVWLVFTKGKAATFYWVMAETLRCHRLCGEIMQA
ncbi:uncharacterized protein AB675_7433 [Cyphellophora attinorum]|uniref:Cupin type-2 domain-containing protein n=1 Tax=Cyphellophora attinorum TaxID=1664694 RepID=A0A0N1HUA5_9EURO|nr:uncharacterized protein AB675_7433 [Phialophora attinorum]KPI40416.1 hypothetical protein AB675_7433 [Phialophora attinorum]